MRFAWSRFVKGAGLAVLATAALSAWAGAGRAPAATLDPAPYPAPPGTRLVIAPLGVGSPIDVLERHGFRVAVAIPPRSYYVVEVRGLHLLPPGFDWGGPPASPVTSRASVLPGADAASDSAAAGLSALGGGSPLAEDPFGGRIDALPPLRPPSPRRVLAAPGLLGETPGLYHGTRWGDTSEFMIGRVAVGLLFAESDGTLDASQYD